jgi:vacuolar protein sorting-associated protein 54
MPNNTTPTRQSIDNNTRITRTASGVKLAYLASSQQPFYQTNLASIPNMTSLKSDVHVSPPPPPTIITSNANNTSTTHSRPFARDDNTNPNSRPPSIRSATSFGRPLSRFISGQHTRHHSNYSNFSTMSETALPWTTRDIGFNAISGKKNNLHVSK